MVKIFSRKDEKSEKRVKYASSMPKYACKRHRLYKLPAHHLIKAKSEISPEEFTSKSERSAKRHELFRRALQKIT